jgi:hypothetical protein
MVFFAWFHFIGFSILDFLTSKIQQYLGSENFK